MLTSDMTDRICYFPNIRVSLFHRVSLHPAPTA
uniref:Uncharacterized protein n=1 Tax=Anguilla anguilla TaxID=7936 RepID=A0A0E9U7K7_ANGAN